MKLCTIEKKLETARLVLDVDGYSIFIYTIFQNILYLYYYAITPLKNYNIGKRQITIRKNIPLPSITSQYHSIWQHHYHL